MKKYILPILALLICTSAYATGKFAVQGAVYLSNGTPAAGLTVQIVRKQGKASRVLGSTTTARDGKYRITYSPRKGLKVTAVLVRVLDRKGTSLYHSPPIGRTKSLHIVNVTLP